MGEQIGLYNYISVTLLVVTNSKDFTTTTSALNLESSLALKSA